MPIKKIFAFLLVILSVSAQAATLTRESLGDLALEATYADAATSTGDLALNTDGKLLLHAKNLGAATATVTVTAQTTSREIPGFGTLTRADIVATLAPSEEAFLGPFPKSSFNTASGNVSISYGGTADDVDISALKLP